jgi:hypothetical protein
VPERTRSPQVSHSNANTDIHSAIRAWGRPPHFCKSCLRVLLVTVHIRFGTIQRRPTVTRPPQSDRSPGPEGISNCLLPLGRPGGSSYFHVPASGCARIRCRSQQHDLPINASSGRGEKVQATSDCLRKLLDTLRIRFGRIDSSEAPNTANDRADQLALSAACVDGLSLRKLLVPGLLR